MNPYLPSDKLIGYVALPFPLCCSARTCSDLYIANKFSAAKTLFKYIMQGVFFFGVNKDKIDIVAKCALKSGLIRG